MECRLKTININEDSVYKIDYLLEEALIGNFFNKLDEVLSNFAQAFSRQTDLKRMADRVEKQKQARLKYLKDHNVDINKFKKAIKRGQNIQIDYDFIFKQLWEDLKDTTPSDVIKILAAFVILGLAQGAMDGIFAGFLPDPWSGILTAILIAPIFEEMFKRIAVKRGNGLAFTSLFAGLEGWAYINDMLGAGMPLIVALLVRLFAFIFHHVTLFHHQKGEILDNYAKDFKIKPHEENLYKNKASKIAFILHFLWNAAASLPFTETLNSFMTSSGTQLAGGVAFLGAGQNINKINKIKKG